MSHRIEKIESLIKEELSTILLFKLQDPIFGFLTITKVKASPDLKSVKVYISIFEKEKRAASIAKLNEVAPFVRSELAQRLTIRYTPEVKLLTVVGDHIP